MPPKRRHTAEPNQSKKAKVPQRSREDLEAFYASTLDLIYELKDDEDGRQLVSVFQKIPSKKQYPDYFEIIANPISISEIQKKVSKGQYSTESADEFLKDFELMHNNAATYNDPESWIVNDAKRILDLVNEEYDKLNNESQSTAEITPEQVPQAATDLINDVIEHEFPDLGAISDPFMDVVDRKEYPDYFQVIQHPTSFNQVLADIKSKKLFSGSDSIANELEDFHREVNYIFQNAQLYNDPESLLHQDSLKLQEYFNNRFEDFKSSVKTSKPSSKKEGGPKLKLSLKLKPTEKDESETPEPSKNVVSTIKRNALGKIDKSPIPSEAFIQGISVSSASSTVTSVIQNSHNHNYLPQQLTQSQKLKSFLFPDHPLGTSSSLFEYHFAPAGYMSQSYTISLPPDTNSLITLKVALHSLIHDIKRDSIEDGQLLMNLGSDDDFNFKLSVNDDEVSSGGEVIEERDTDEDILSAHYDLKLSHGLNVLDFELKVAPAIAKRLKKTTAESEVEENLGRHTRHQLQQLKMNWDVEKFTIYVICNSV
ncbi:Bromodomain-containing protein [Hyphopichia burtonii NRRL Y-1933]|uniref:Bromodomain-containing protein n=1 Tax=Hyphopichia burtonii NRRL Y-1933 TaxID=984485 RepID=A0A1E4RJP4_9ASCO|nr:Bromodomain-containing protein [Hyphopichia burtonii NRRL Y-1933]ODV67497.1 Bromodomain-containing protein [Hyphopichia burtonii NRRL Y-1933]